MAGQLFVVATPIGNLEDITQRALRVLAEVDAVAAEDTRHSRKLFEHYGISTPMVSYHDHSERAVSVRLVARLLEGDSIALICDAGTPGIADPGYRLVGAAIEAGIEVVPVPGPSAFTACLSVGGLPTDRFVFEGFIPSRSAARRAFFARFADEPRTVVCFEASRRLVDSLRDLEGTLGVRRVVIGREISKMYETFVRGTAGAVATELAETPLRGEVTLLIAGADAPRRAEAADVRSRIDAMRLEGMGMKEIAKSLVATTGWSAREIYHLGVSKGE